MIGVQVIMMGQQDIVVVGGMESMFNVFYYVFNVCWGSKYGNFILVDGLVKDGLIDVYDGQVMGICVDVIVEKYNISCEI